MRRILTALAVSGQALFTTMALGTASEEGKSDPRKAICILNAESGETANGVVWFEQADLSSKTSIKGKFKGLKPNHKHGFHIHEFGNLSEGCKTAGAHFNPFKKTHGSPKSEERHVGDLGNVEADASGNSSYEIEDHLITLFGDMDVSGRACVLHKNTDDLGKGNDEESKKTGNAGARIACGIIGKANF